MMFIPKQATADYYSSVQQSTIPHFHYKMLVANIYELDQLPFLKQPRYPWPYEAEEGEKSKTKLLENLRIVSYQHADLIAKIFTCDFSLNKLAQQQPENHQPQLIVTTEKQITSLQNFYYLANELLPQAQFSAMVADVKRFVMKVRDFVSDLVYSKHEIDFKNKDFLTFGVYLKKLSPNSLRFNNQQHAKTAFDQFTQNNHFYIKCAITNFSYDPSRDFSQLKTFKPEPFEITHPLIKNRLFTTYSQLAQTHLPITDKQAKKYLHSFDTYTYFCDEEYLKYQVLKNYPLLRSKFYMPVIFNDKLTNQRLDGPIFSNSDPDCMFAHFVGYNPDRIKDLQGHHCQQCRAHIDGVQQNPIMTYLRDNPFNPLKADVLFCPEFNRFKLIVRTPIARLQNEEEEEEELERRPKVKTQIKYLNYLHLRANVKKMTTKKRSKYNDMLENEKFPLTFELWGRKLPIMDPARGKHCPHYQFTDLRSYYLNQLTPTTFECPICRSPVTDSDLLYLKQTQTLMKYLKFKCKKSPQLLTTGFCYINHLQSKVFLDYKKRNTDNRDIIQTDIVEIKNYYQHFVDPYYSFNEYALGMPDKYQQKMKQRYLFGGEGGSDDYDEDFQYKEYLPDKGKVFAKSVNLNSMEQE